MRDPRSQFGPTAEKYLTSAVHSDASALQHLVEITQPHGGIWIDVATGAGHTAFTFSPYVDRMIATDITEQMLHVVKRTAKERNLENIQCCFAEAGTLPFQTGSLDGVCCRLGAHHFPDPTFFVREAARVLKPGGTLLLVDTIGVEGDDGADAALQHFETIRDPSHKRNLRTREWKELITSVGLTVRHDEEHTKHLETEDWMERMRVSDSDKTILRQMLSDSSDALREYLAPRRDEEGRSWFTLWETAIVASA